MKMLRKVVVLTVVWGSFADAIRRAFTVVW